MWHWGRCYEWITMWCWSFVMRAPKILVTLEPPCSPTGPIYATCHTHDLDTRPSYFSACNKGLGDDAMDYLFVCVSFSYSLLSLPPPSLPISPSHFVSLHSLILSLSLSHTHTHTHTHMHTCTHTHTHTNTHTHRSDWRCMLFNGRVCCKMQTKTMDNLCKTGLQKALLLL